ncbi:MAG TPA: hypothetical protein VGN61_06685 [Verrucomicrobiae bacterium]
MKILLSLMVLVVAGCASNLLEPAVETGDYGVPDSMPMPAKGMTPAQVQQMYVVPGGAPTLT